MKNIKLTVEIKKPADFVFEFTTNPKNTPKWVDGITKEITNEWPAQKGTTYKNQRGDGSWKTYEVTEFILNKSFTLSEQGGKYHVKYTVTPISDTSCSLEYSEFVDSGDIETPFTVDILQKLKDIIESQ